MVESAKVIRRGRGRPRREPTADDVSEPKVPKKRGRKPGSLGKKKLEAQRLLALANSSSISNSLAASPHLPDKANEDYTSLRSPSTNGFQKSKLGDSTSDLQHLNSQPRSNAHEFIEPELATPQAGYSGYPLEAFPPQQKLKLSIAGNPRGRRPKTDNSLRSTPSLSEAEAEEAEQMYRLQLETPKSEAISMASDMRTTTSNGKKIPKKRGRPPKDLSSSPSGLKIRIPATPKSKRVPEGEQTTSRVKRLKITSPKKQPLVGLVPAAEKTPETDDSNGNEDFCASCGGTGVFICCDSCPRSFHLLCCEPPIQEIPEENWNCNECRAAQGLDGRKYHNSLGVFGSLLNSMHGRNPVEFRLPRKLRDATFIDVATGPEGNYTDSHVKPEPTLSKLNGSQIIGFNKNEDLEIDTLYDKNGRPLLCHRCRESGLKRRSLIACDYCPLHWHLDCLDEFVSSSKPFGRKWRCPNHVESLAGISMVDRRAFRESAVLDSGLHSNFLKFSEARNIMVKFEDQGYISELKQPSLAEYLSFQKDDFVSNKSDFITKFSLKFENTPDSENEEDTISSFRPPDFLENYTVKDKIVAKASRKQARVLLMTNADDSESKPFIYRVPEKQILLDFLRKGVESTKTSTLNTLNEYESKKREEQAKDEEAVATLFSLNSAREKDRDSKQSLNIDELLKVTSTAGSNTDQSNVMDDGELDELRKIKKLMSIKGRDAMLQFLRT